MVMFPVWIVARSVVTADESPAPIIRSILIRAMKRVAMEKQHVARLHFALNQFKLLFCLFHTAQIGTNLITIQKSMINTTEVM